MITSIGTEESSHKSSCCKEYFDVKSKSFGSICCKKNVASSRAPNKMINLDYTCDDGRISKFGNICRITSFSPDIR